MDNKVNYDELIKMDNLSLLFKIRELYSKMNNHDFCSFIEELYKKFPENDKRKRMIEDLSKKFGIKGIISYFSKFKEKV